MKTLTYPLLSIIWMERGDLPKILKIEGEAHKGGTAWSQDDFIRELREKNTVGMVVKDKDTIVGFVLYVLHLKKIHILHAGATESQYLQVFKAILDKVKSKLVPGRRIAVTMNLRESDLRLQNLLKGESFKAFAVERGFFIDTDEDAYLFKYEIHDDNPSLLSPAGQEMLD